jgi:hypothetical protein
MREETFFNYKNYKWMWIHLAGLIVAILAYWLHDPVGAPSGDTWLGYTLGTLSALAMATLMWFGVRKRAYYSSSTTLKGALAVHVWLGLSLILLVPLHSGFSFGFNVHTLAYILIILTILTGVWGAVVYLTMAPEVVSHRGKGSLKELLEKVTFMSTAADALTLNKSPVFINLAKRLDHQFQPTLWGMIFGTALPVIDQRGCAAELATFSPNEQEDGLRLIGICSKKIEQINLIRREVRAQFWLKAWLYFHLPLACGAFAVTIIHILSVFFFW